MEDRNAPGCSRFSVTGSRQFTSPPTMKRPRLLFSHNSLFQLGVALVIGGSLRADDAPAAKDLALSLQAAFAEAIERAEPSLVSVVRIRHPDTPEPDSFLR